MFLTPNATSPTKLACAKSYETKIAKIDPWLLKFNAYRISDNDYKFKLLISSINNYLQDQDLKSEQVIMIVPRNLFYQEDGFELRNDEIFRQIMYYYPDIEVLELAPNREYYLKGKNYQTQTVNDQNISISKEKKNLIIIAQNIEEQDEPNNLKISKQQSIYVADLENNYFKFLGYQFNLNSQSKTSSCCGCK